MSAPSTGDFDDDNDEDDDEDAASDSVDEASENENDISLRSDNDFPGRTPKNSAVVFDMVAAEGREQVFGRPLLLSGENSIPMLSMSETRALISYGSGEDEDEEDEVVSQDELLAAVEEQTAVVTTSNQEHTAVVAQQMVSSQSRTNKNVSRNACLF